MPDAFVTTILPYTVILGIAVSVIASVALVIGPFLKGKRLRSDVLPRLTAIEAAIKRDASRIDARLPPASDTLEPGQAQLVVSDLYEIAQDLQDKAGEVHRLLDQIGSDAQLAEGIEDRVKIVDLGKSVVQTESYLAAVLNRIERQKSKLAAMQSAQAASKG